MVLEQCPTTSTIANFQKYKHLSLIKEQKWSCMPGSHKAREKRVQAPIHWRCMPQQPSPQFVDGNWYGNTDGPYVSIDHVQVSRMHLTARRECPKVIQK